MRGLVMMVCIGAAVGRVATAAPPSETPPAESITYGERSETVATGLTIAGIAAPIGLAALMYEPDTDNPMWAPVLFLGSIPGPALGHWYSNKVGGYGMLMRFGGFMSFIVGWELVDNAKRCARGEPVEDGCSASDRSVGRTMQGIGGLVWGASWIYDIWSARREARRYNKRHTFTVTPMPGERTTGISLGGSF